MGNRASVPALPTPARLSYVPAHAQTFLRFEEASFLKWARAHGRLALIIATSSENHEHYCCIVVRACVEQNVDLRYMQADEATLTEAWEQARQNVRLDSSLRPVRGCRSGCGVLVGAPSTLAVFGRCISCTKLLLQSGRFDPNSVDHLGRAPLHEACSADDFANHSATALLLRAGADPNKRCTLPPLTVPPLVCAALCESMLCVNALLHAGADPTLLCAPGAGKTPVTVAELYRAHAGDHKITALLVQKATERVLERLSRDPGSYFSVLRAPTDENGTRNPLLGVLALHCAWCAPRRLTSGVQMEDQIGRTAGEFELLQLVHGAHTGGDECARVATLLRAGTSTRALYNRFGLLHCGECLLLFVWCYACATALLDAGFPVDARDPVGRTPLLIAAGDCDGGAPPDARIAQLLIARGAQVNMPNDRGNTPIVHAATKGRLALVRALFAAGARPDALVHALDRDDMGLAVLLADWTLAHGRPRTAAFLRYATALALLTECKAHPACYLNVLPESALLGLVAQCMCQCQLDLSDEESPPPPAPHRDRAAEALANAEAGPCGSQIQ